MIRFYSNSDFYNGSQFNMHLINEQMHLTLKHKKQSVLVHFLTVSTIRYPRRKCQTSFCLKCSNIAFSSEHVKFLFSYSSSTKRSSASTLSPTTTWVAFTLPPIGACTAISIFMAERTATTCPASTTSPGSTFTTTTSAFIGAPT